MAGSSSPKPDQKSNTLLPSTLFKITANTSSISTPVPAPFTNIPVGETSATRPTITAASFATNPDLWELARLALSDELQSELAIVTASSAEKLPASVIYSVESFILVHKDAKYRRVFDKIIKAAKKFVNIGDVISSYDSAHAALPWAAVRAIIVLSTTSSSSVYQVIADGLETTSCLITQYKILEVLYLRTVVQVSTELRKELEKALVDLYKSTLTFLAKARKFCSLSKIKRLAQGIMDPSKELNNILLRISSQQLVIDRLASLASAENSVIIDGSSKARLDSILADLQKPLGTISSRISSIQDFLEKNERQKAISWISPIHFEDHYKAAIQKVLRGTGEWFFDEPQFLVWKKSNFSSIFWLHGSVGVGKSCLTSLFLKSNIQESTYSRTVYFYCFRSASQPERSEPIAILRSFARQLASAGPGLPLLPSALELYNARKEQGFSSNELTLSETIGLIVDLVKEYADVTFVLDALDECGFESSEESSQIDIIDALEEIICQSNIDGSCLVRIFVSSRNNLIFKTRFLEYRNVEIDAIKNEYDISQVVHSRLQDLLEKGKILPGIRIKKDVKKWIMKKLIEGAGGMFQWVNMQLESLRSIKTMSDLKSELGALPPDLEDIYKNLYSRIQAYHPFQKTLTETALQLAMYSFRPLEIDMFLAVLPRDEQLLSDSDSETSACSDPTLESGCSGTPRPYSESQILDSCCHFLSVDPTTHTIRLSHLSVREFLEHQHSFTPLQGHIGITSNLLDILIRDSLQALGEIPKNRKNPPSKLAESSAKKAPFPYAYAAKFWVQHYAQTRSIKLQDPVKSLLSRFLETETDYSSSFFGIWISYTTYFYIKPLQFLQRFSQQKSNSRPDRLAFPSWGSKLLGFRHMMLLPFCCETGYCEILQLVINNDRGLIKTSERAGVHFLSKAFESNHVEIIQILKDNGANLNIISSSESPVFFAIRAKSLETAEYLFDTSASTNQAASAALHALTSRDLSSEPWLLFAKKVLDVMNGPLLRFTKRVLGVGNGLEISRYHRNEGPYTRALQRYNTILLGLLESKFPEIQKEKFNNPVTRANFILFLMRDRGYIVSHEHYRASRALRHNKSELMVSD